MDFAFVFARSFSVPEDNIFAIIFNNKAVRSGVHFSGCIFSNLYSSGSEDSFKEPI